MEREQSSGGTILIVLALVFAVLMAIQSAPHLMYATNSSNCTQQPSADQWQQMSQSDRLAYAMCYSNNILKQQENNK